MTFFWTVNGISLRFWRVSGGILPAGCEWVWQTAPYPTVPTAP